MYSSCSPSVFLTYSLPNESFWYSSGIPKLLPSPSFGIVENALKYVLAIAEVLFNHFLRIPSVFLRYVVGICQVFLRYSLVGISCVLLHITLCLYIICVYICLGMQL